MGTAYTPGLKVSSGTTIRKERRLPLKGQLMVLAGERVHADTVVARTDIPGVIQTVKVAETLGLEPPEAMAALTVAKGDRVESGQVVASNRSFFGLIRTDCRTPFTGTVEMISNATGHIGVRLPARPVEVRAYVDGVVADLIGDEGVVIETYGAMVQGIFGVGGERSGVLRIVESARNAPLDAGSIGEEDAGRVLVGGAGATLEAIRKAASLGVAGLVLGAVVDTDLVDYLGYDIGVAITGQEDIPTTIILTEGFGDIEMAGRTLALLKSLAGRTVSINGATQIRAGVIRPEIIAPLDIPAATGAATGSRQSLDIGSHIRVIREPYFGALGTVRALPSEPVEVESGAVVRVLEAELADSRRVEVPRANVEIVES